MTLRTLVQQVNMCVITVTELGIRMIAALSSFSKKAYRDAPNRLLKLLSTRIFSRLAHVTNTAFWQSQQFIQSLPTHPQPHWMEQQNHNPLQSFRLQFWLKQSLYWTLALTVSFFATKVSFRRWASVKVQSLLLHHKSTSIFKAWQGFIQLDVQYLWMFWPTTFLEIALIFFLDYICHIWDTMLTWTVNLAQRPSQQSNLSFESFMIQHLRPSSVLQHLCGIKDFYIFRVRPSKLQEFLLYQLRTATRHAFQLKHM